MSPLEPPRIDPLPPGVLIPSQVIRGERIRQPSAEEQHVTQGQQWQAIFAKQDSEGFDKTRPIALTKENARVNVPWGDILSEKSSSYTRLHVSNVNGIPLDTLCKLHIEIQADLFCWQEHNLDTTQLAVRSILYDTARQYWPRNCMVFGTTPITFHTRYKFGGTFILSTGNLSGRVVKQTRDTMGRWVVQELIGSQGRKIAIVSAYQPVDKTIIPGTTTVAAQQHSLLVQAQDAIIQPRQAFRRDLLAMLQNLRQAQCELLLVLGDFNEAFGSDPEGMSKIAGQLGLVDIMASRHSSPLPTTFTPGIKCCLDYGLATQHVCDALQHARYEAFNARVHSDHRGYFMDFDTKHLFGTDNPDLVSPSKRGLRSNNIHQVTAYIKKKYALLLAHNAFERMVILQKSGDRHAFAE